MITFKQFVGSASSLSMMARDFLNRWTSGSSSALRLLTPSVKRQLAPTVKEETYTVYRGWKFHDEEMANWLFPNLQTGETTVTLKSPHSWTKDRHEARKFSNAKFDSFEKRWVDSDDLDEMGYDRGDLLGIGVLVSATISKDQVIADLTQIPSSMLAYDDGEQEIITAPSDFKVTIISVEKFFHDDESGEDNFDLENHNHESDEENIMMQKNREFVENEFKGKTVTINSLIDFINKHKDEGKAIGVISVFGYKFPDIIKYAEDHANKFKKTYKHFSVAIVANFMNAIAKHHPADSTQGRE